MFRFSHTSITIKNYKLQTRNDFSPYPCARSALRIPLIFQHTHTRRSEDGSTRTRQQLVSWKKLANTTIVYAHLYTHAHARASSVCGFVKLIVARCVVLANDAGGCVHSTHIFSVRTCKPTSYPKIALQQRLCGRWCVQPPSALVIVHLSSHTQRTTTVLVFAAAYCYFILLLLCFYRKRVELYNY